MTSENEQYFSSVIDNDSQDDNNNNCFAVTISNLLDKEFSDSKREKYQKKKKSKWISEQACERERECERCNDNGVKINNQSFYNII